MAGMWYHVPYVSIKDAVYQRMKDGTQTRERLMMREIFPDGIDYSVRRTSIRPAHLTVLLQRMLHREVLRLAERIFFTQQNVREQDVLSAS